MGKQIPLKKADAPAAAVAEEAKAPVIDFQMPEKAAADPEMAAMLAEAERFIEKNNLHALITKIARSTGKDFADYDGKRYVADGTFQIAQMDAELEHVTRMLYHAQEIEGKTTVHCCLGGKWRDAIAGMASKVPEPPVMPVRDLEAQKCRFEEFKE